MPGFDLDPCSQLALKACIAAYVCLLEGEPDLALGAQATFLGKAAAKLSVQVDGQTVCLLAALALAFATAGKTMPPIPPLPKIPDLSSFLPPIPKLPGLPMIPGITITYAEDGVTPIHIDF